MQTITKTNARLIEMLTENTGISLLDSGGANGRNWQRNQNQTIEDWENRPSASLDTEYGLTVTLDLYKFLSERLQLTEWAENLQTEFELWIKQDPERSEFSCWDMEEWAKENFNADCKVHNTYNWDNCLSQDIQFVEFQTMDETRFVLLQIHGGADARGGYTKPQIFEITSEFWIYDCDRFSIGCKNQKCGYFVSVTGFNDAWDSEGTPLSYDSLHDMKVCRECGAELEAYAEEAN